MCCSTAENIIRFKGPLNICLFLRPPYTLEKVWQNLTISERLNDNLMCMEAITAKVAPNLLRGMHLLIWRILHQQLSV